MNLVDMIMVGFFGTIIVCMVPIIVIGTCIVVRRLLEELKEM